MLFFATAFVFSFWAATVGWRNPNLRGVEFRQAQTALSTYFIQSENNFSLAYPTPVFGKPWSIPLEFPLYQWTVAVVGNLTGWALVPTARGVSLACFYLTLPAIYLLLGLWEIPSGRRYLILALVVSCPLYIFYSRAFLIETMALMLSVWFLLAYLRAMTTGKWGWLVAANFLGAAAGTVKVTTFLLYLAPAAGWTLVQFWHARPHQRQPGSPDMRVLLMRGVEATLLPFVATLAWAHFSDVVKAQNPSGAFMVSANLRGYYFGTQATRFSAAVWAGHWKIFSQSVIWLPVAIAGAMLSPLISRRSWPQIGLCLACFMGVQVLFPELYAWHEYYYVANTLFLIVALGIVVTGMFESRLPRWIPVLVLLGLGAGQAHHYFKQFYTWQSEISGEGSDLTRTLAGTTGPEDVVLVTGDDWNSMIPYYSRRRALMLRAGVEQNEAELRAAFSNLKGESVGALASREILPPDSMLMKLAVEYFGFNPRPMLKLPGHYLYFPEARWEGLYDQLQEKPMHEVFWAPPPEGGIFAETMAAQWHETSELKRYQTIYFKYMQPQPVGFFCRFGLSLNEGLGEPHFGAHPLTRLRFAVPAGHHRLTTMSGISPGAYDNLSAADATDGIEIKLTVFRSGRPEQVVYSRLINPRDNPADRGDVPLTAEFDMPADAELELSVTSGPDNSDRRDWAYLGRLKIE